MVHFGHHEHPGGDTLADGEIHPALIGRQQAPGAGRHQHFVQVVTRAGRAVHPRLVRGQAGGIGDGGHFHHGLGPIDKFDQHPGIHVAAQRLIGIGIGGGVDVQRVVLALARADDAVTHRADKLDQFHAG